MSLKCPRDLFFDQLRDIRSAESMLATALPTMAARGPYPPLAALLTRHADETRRQLDVITSIFETNDIPMGGEPCKCIEGLLKGGDAHLDAVETPETRDLMMIAICLRMEHCEMAAYNLTLRLAEQLGFTQEAALLAGILREEETAAAALIDLQPVLFERAVQRIVL